MAEYLIQDYTMEALANQARRVSGTTEGLSSAEIVEILSKLDGSINENGQYLIQAMDNGGAVLKSGVYNSGEVFALPTHKPVSPVATFQEWTSPIELDNEHFFTVKNIPTTVSAIMAPNDDAFIICVLTSAANQTVTFNIELYKGCIIDWGDGTTETCTGYLTSISHTYLSSETYYYITISSNEASSNPSVSDTLCADNLTASLVTHIFMPTWMETFKGVCGGNGSTLKTAFIASGAMTDIAYGAFQYCNSLKHIAIPKGITKISDMAFAGCTNLTDAILPYGLAEIGVAFAGCKNLKSIVIPKSVTSINENSFNCCETTSTSSYSNFSGIWVDKDNPNYSSDEQGVLYNKDKTTLLRAPCCLTNITIPETVTTINGHAFYGCMITSIVIPDNVTTIGKYAFAYCHNLQNVAIGNGIEYIGSYAFYYCPVPYITIPASVVTIGSKAFQNAFVNGIIDGNYGAVFKDTNGWSYYGSETATNGTGIPVSTLNDSVKAADMLRMGTSSSSWWKKG